MARPDPTDGGPEDRLAAAKHLMAEQRLNDAAVALRALLRDYPRYLQARYELGVVCYHLGALDEAVTLIADVCVLNPAGLNSDVLYFALVALPDPGRALAVLERFMPELRGSNKLIELFGRLARQQAAAAGGPAPDIEVIGDSHAIANFSLIPRCRVHSLGPMTMNHVERQPLDLAGLGIGPGATLVTVFGEIDCRCHMIELVRQMGTTAQALARRVATGFVASLGRTMERGGARAAAICSIIPPPRDTADNPDFPTVGSAEARRDMTQTLNHELAQAAERASVGFLDIGSAYTDADGYLDPAKSDGLVHIDFRLIGPVAARLDAVFGPEGSRRGATAPVRNP
jgi:hypothetical protein